MKYLGGSLGLLFIPIIVKGILGILEFPKKAEKGKVYLPKFFVILGVIVSVVFLIPLIITFFTGEPVWIPILFLLFSLLGIVLIIAFVNCRVEYHEDGFTAKNFFGIKRYFTYDQVDAVKEDMHEDYLLIGKHKVMIDEYAIGGYDFIAFVRKQYRKLHKGQALPVVRKDRGDIFHGNVTDACGFLFAYISVGVFILAFGVFMAYNIWFCPTSAGNTAEQKVTFEAGVVDDEEYIMTSSSGEAYRILFWNERENRNAIEKACRNSAELTVFSKEVKDKKGTTQYWNVAEIRSENEVLMSFDETNRLNQKEFAPMIWLPIGFAIHWGLFIAGSIIVGRNPRKYRKFVKLFFKSGYVRY